MELWRGGLSWWTCGRKSRPRSPSLNSPRGPEAWWNSPSGSDGGSTNWSIGSGPSRNCPDPPCDVWGRENAISIVLNEDKAGENYSDNNDNNSEEAIGRLIPIDKNGRPAKLYSLEEEWCGRRRVNGDLGDSPLLNGQRTDDLRGMGGWECKAEMRKAKKEEKERRNWGSKMPAVYTVFFTW